jgi:hypothetical protein
MAKAKAFTPIQSAAKVEFKVWYKNRQRQWVTTYFENEVDARKAAVSAVEFGEKNVRLFRVTTEQIG